ncbi:unnamed protein product [Schistocephalus solidus]|uniref:Tubulin polyglutamylase TTLL7 n=1 Tax=Schistocephalus solidus TaxID=70667 RepID=A0A183T750_SCHSO|nr:unnamed protein product [Schistocephalus solidus]
MYRHLTNYTLNKRHHQYIRCDDESTGSKRSFAFLDNYIQENLQSDPQIIWRRIRNLIVKTMIIGAPHINHAYRLFHRGSGRPTSLSYLSCDTVRTAKGCSRTSSCSQASDRKAWNMAPQRTVKNGSNSGSTGRAASAAATIASDRASIAIRSAAFEILGFDIMLDRNLRPWLIEVNRSPSFGCDQELDVRVKSGLLRDALHLINIRPSDKQMAEEAMKMRSIRRLLSASPSQVLLSSVSQDSIPLHHISPKLVSSASNKAKNEPYIKHGSPNSQDLAADWLQKPSELYRRIRELRERLFEMQRESELECFENANCGNWRRAYPTSDRVLEQRYARLLTNAFLDFNKGSEGDLLHVIQLSQPGGQQLQKPRKPASKPRRCPATSSKRSSRSHFSSEKCTSGECGEREDFVDVEGGEDDSEALGARSLTTYGPEAYGETSDSSEDASWSPRNYFGYRGHLGIEFFTDNAMTATCAYHRNPLGINALQKRTMTLGRNTIRF